MSILILFLIMALLLFGPRRGGGRPGPVATTLGIAFLLLMAIMFALGRLWQTFFGASSQL